MKGKSFIRKKRRPKRRKIKKNTYTHLLKGLHLYPFRHIHILILASFFMLVSSIVLLPTVIVSLPKEEKEEAYDEAEAQTVDVSEEQVTVPVMRTESEAIDDVPLEQYV